MWTSKPIITVFTDMFCRFPYHMSLTSKGQTERVSGELVSGTYFPVLGVGAALGRTFTPEEDRIPNGHPVVMLSYAYWQNRFGGKADVIGKNVSVNGHNMTVVGVAQQGFEGVELGYTPQVFVPVMMKAQMTPNWDDMKERRSRWVNVFGRLKPGVTLSQAKASLQPFFHSMLEQEVKEKAFNDASAYSRQQFLKSYIDVLPGSQGRSEVRRMLATPLWVLLCITAGVLLIACANVANLLIAKATARQKEMAIRLSLGASRGRIISQLLVESLLLSLLGGAAGLVLALWTDGVLLRFLPPETASLTLSTTPDLRILAFTIGVSMFTGLLFGLVPALQATSPDVAPTLKDQAGAVVGGGSQAGLRKALVAAQVTLSLLLLIGAGLFIRSLANLRGLGPGFNSGNLIAFNLDASLNGYSSDKSKALYLRLTDEIGSIPGVQSVGLAAVRILENNEWDSSVNVEGYRAKQGEDIAAYMNAVSPGYFATLGVPILAGRDFRRNDVEELQHGPDKDNTVPRVVMINEKLARKYFKDGNALGRHIGFGSDLKSKADMEVIGIVKDIKYTSLRDEVARSDVRALPGGTQRKRMTVYVRSP